MAQRLTDADCRADVIAEFALALREPDGRIGVGNQPARRPQVAEHHDHTVRHHLLRPIAELIGNPEVIGQSHLNGHGHRTVTPHGLREDESRSRAVRLASVYLGAESLKKIQENYQTFAGRRQKMDLVAIG